MGFKKAILVLLLLIILTMGAASAADNNTTSDNLAATEDKNLELNENDEVLSIDSTDVISDPGNGSYTPGNGSIVTGGTFSDLDNLIQNAGSELILNDDYTYSDGDSDYITISKNGFTIDGNGHTINSMSKSRIFYITAENVVLKNINFINGSSVVRGGAIHWNGENGTLSNCNFINNSAIGTSTGGGGGAVYINSNCKVVNCNFTNNQVSDSYEGGAIYFYNNGNVTNCNFVNNTGAVYFLMGNGNVTNCNFTNNTAKRYGGAIYFNREGNVTNCNFINNQAHDSYDGGAIRIGRNGIVTNCNFTNNTANFGGAIYIIMKGKVTNSNFIANSAKSHGGAIYIEGKSNVSNCNFTNNTASYYGGAIRFESDSNITNSNFIANSAKSRGGAIYIEGKINVSNCNFTNNTAKNYGGAVYFEVGTTGNITNCNFIKCSAENAKAIYANNNTLISNCNFETQGSESLSELVVGGIISNCTINGNKEKTATNMTVTVDDITYGENATFTVILPSDATGILNITVGNMAFTADVSDEPIIAKFSGLDIGTYIANITYTGDLKYLPANANETFTVSTKGNKTFTDLKNLIDSASSGDTIELDDDYTNDGSITADGITISKPITIDGNGHTLNANGKSGLFKLNVDNIILNNIEFLNASHEAISVSGSNCKIINCNFNNCSPINSSSDYGIGGGVVSMNSGSIVNCSFINCVHDIQKTISGGVLSVRNSDVINCRFFNCTYGCDLVYGGAIYLSKSRIINCSFSYCGDACNIIYGGAINGEGSVINCTFSNCTIDSSYSAYVHFEGPSNLTNSIFIDCISAVCCNYGCVGNITNCTFEACSVSAIGFWCEGGNVTDCKFNDCTSTAIYVHDSYVNIVGCIFKNCSSDEGGAINIVERYDNVINCSFIDCSAERGGAIYAGDCNNTIINCSFINCSAQKGGSIYWNSKNGKILNSNFTYSQATNGGAIYVDEDIVLTVCSSKFEYNTAEQVGGAIYFNVLGNVTNCTFNGNSNPEIYPNNRTSDTNSTFTELKDLIDSANSGDTIDLSGYYYGSGSSISIDKTVTLRGIGETVLDAKGLSSILSVSANNVRIENIKFVNGQNSGNWGGAIHWEGDSGVLINSTFVNNAASWGAGIFWWAQDGYMANCTFENNTAERYGGALYVNGENLRMLNSLFKNNIVTESISSWEGGGAIYTDGNNHLVANSTFIDNKAINSWGGAIKHGSETASYQSNEFYNNTAIRGNSVWESDANNLVNNIFNLNSIDEIASCVEDANLSALFENNIFKVKGIVISKDDYFNKTDTGSNESSQNITQSTFTDITNLISNAHAGDTINLEGTYYGTGSIITVNKELTINGDGETVLDAKNLSGIMSVSADNVRINNIRFINGKINANGGAINWIGRNGTISNCTFINCSAENGGSVYWNAENGMINKSTFDHSIATQNGGAIYWNANNGEITDSIFTHSYAQNGGAVYVPENRNVEIKSSIFDNNMAEEESGAVYGGTVDDDCTFKNNTYTPLNTTTIISINETAVYTGNEISITTLILSQKGGLVNTGTVEIYINSKLIATIPANTAYIYKTGDVGTYQVLAKFNDDSSYKDSSSTAEFTVIPVDIPEEIETSTAGIFTLEFPDDAEGTLTVFIDGTKYKVYDIIGGILKIDLSDKKGKYNITFEYSGDKNYPAFKKDANITVETNPSITASNAKVIYSAGTTYKITVYKNKGITANDVNVVIKQNNKKFKTIKTNSKGVASFKVTQTPGTYKLKITSLGKTVTKTLTVKHIVTLKTATVKKSAKKLILQATLAKVNKKYLKKKTVTFKFNGKTYKAKTNSKGVAKVTIKSNVLKKLKVGKKITYQTTYLKDTVKKTVKVKK